MKNFSSTLILASLLTVMTACGDGKEDSDTSAFVGPAPNLRILLLSCQNGLAKISVQNFGNTASNPTTLQVEDKKFNVPKLIPTRDAANFDINVKRGTTPIAVVDPEGKVIESNENDNTLKITCRF